MVRRKEVRGAQPDEASQTSSHETHQESQLRDILGILPDPVCRWTAGGDILFANPAFYQAFAPSGQTASAASIWQLLPSADHDRFRRAMDTLALDGRRHTLEQRLNTPQGIRWLHWIITPVAGEGPPVVFQGAARDVTPIKAHQVTLSNGESRYKSLLETTTDMITVNWDRRFVYVNPAGLHLLGASDPDDVMGKTLDDFIHPSYHDKAYEQIELALQSGQARKPIEIKLIRLDDLVMDVEMAATPVTHNNEAAVLLIVRDITERKRAEEALHRLSLLDELTGVANRRGFEQTMDMEWRRALRQVQPLSVLMVDVDNFKRFNDRYGHPIGDECLRAVARAQNRCLRRAGDFLARYGGEEFIVILPSVDEPSALKVAEDLRAAVEALDIQHEDSDAAPVVTVSVGVASTMPTHDRSPRDLVAAADRALYLAKHGGRNRVCSAGNLASTM